MFLAAGFLLLGGPLVAANPIRAKGVVQELGGSSILQVESNVGVRRDGADAQRSESLSSALAQQGQRARQRAQRRMSSRGGPEALEDWKDNGGAVASSLSKDVLESMAEGITGDVYSKALHAIVDPETSRFVGDAGNKQSSDFIKQAFIKYGFQTSVQTLKTDSRMSSYLRTGAPSPVNVVGVLEGTDLSDETVVVGAHFDSVNWKDTKANDAPGVDDNGSGSALVQVLAKQLSGIVLKPRRTILFVAFNAEEEGLLGSERFATAAKNGKYGDVKAAIIADEVAYPGSGAGKGEAIFETLGEVPGTSSLIDTMAHVHGSTSVGDGISGIKVNWKGFSSDHIPLLKQGIPTVLLIERANMEHADTYGHSNQDTYEHVDMEYGAAMTRLALKTVATLANPAFDDVPLKVWNVVGARNSVPNPIGGASTAGTAPI